MSKVIDSTFGQFNTLYENVTIIKSTIDDYVYIANNTKISRTKIGKFCSIGADVKIGLALHPTNYFTTFPAFYSIQKQCQVFFTDKNHFKESGENIIGNDVWIGENVTILSDISVGDGAVIAAGAVVTKDIEAYSIVGGVPAKHIKYRFDKNKRNELSDLKWWDKDIEWIVSNMPNKAQL
ncbi:CatB-related O-acetyltransferase [Zobellia uliginosa]|uniref:CatB-related O-acetyltransferase n=1 Tax=Zobellia uliginosa TaxID=143224 RepID=UPI001C0786E5|nr:CatB-related O-acetyltransferase [Zobellia uliginosa]MBU2947832.1 CatB-related O-acetyltransferase [Zobellia uliginosa]